MSRPLKKPNYNNAALTEDLLNQVSAAYEQILKDNTNFDPTRRNSESYQFIEQVAKEFNMSPMKMRKLLITAGVYSNDTSRLIADLDAKGYSTEQISAITGLKRSSINGYLPYKKVIYKNKETSVGADRIRLMRERKKTSQQLCSMVSELTASSINATLDCNENDLSELDQKLWEILLLHEYFAFSTLKGLKYKYTIKGGELFVTRKENSKSLTRSSINLAFHNAIRIQYQEGYVKGPKKLGTFGASYLYPIFIKFGIITDKKQKKPDDNNATADGIDSIDINEGDDNGRE